MLRKLLVAIAAATVLATGLSPSVSAATGVGCPTVLPAAQPVSVALDTQATTVGTLASINSTSAPAVTQLATDPTLWVDTCGKEFYTEPIDTAAVTPSIAAAAPYSYSQTFLLHSNPGSNRTIYLDFTGATISGTAWNPVYNAGASFTVPGLSIDADYANFSNSEMDVIQAVWQSVAEDYAAFDVDVTTEAPIADDLLRTSASDVRFGTTAVITDDTLVYSACSCGGIAYTGSFNSVNNTYYEPAFVFIRGLGGATNNKTIAEGVSHEVGHNLGLSHDGQNASAYYLGGSGWAPIMGAGYYEPMSQWSRGEYSGATNTEDDFAVMVAHDLALRGDDFGNTSATSTAVATGSTTNGLIGSATDTDWFSFTPTTTGTYTIAAAPVKNAPDLDIKLDVYNGAALTASIDPAFAKLNSTTATGLDASITTTFTGGVTYYFSIDGVGSGNPATTGYSDYASVGQYTFSVSTSLLDFSSTTIPGGTVGTAYTQAIQGQGGTGPYNFAITSGALPTGLTMATDGSITGLPTVAGSATFTVTLTDSTLATAVRQFTLTIAPPPTPTINVTTLASGNVGTAYSQTLQATGGTAPYTYTISAGTLPAGLSMTSSGVISGTPTAVATASLTFVVTDKWAATASKTLTLTINAALPLALGTTPLPVGSVTGPYSAQLTATGGTAPYTFALNTGQTLPAGLTISATGVISGTPTATSTKSVTFKVTDSTAKTATGTLAFNIKAAPAVSTKTLAAGKVGTAYSATLAGTGGNTPYTWALATGALPVGLTLSSSGIISGTPTQSGSFALTFRITDAANATAVSAAITLSVAAPAALVISTATFANGIIGTAYNATLAGTGGVAPYTWTVSAGALPPGLSMTTAGVVSGTPTTAGTYSFTAKITDAVLGTVTKAFSLTVVPPAVTPSITTVSAPGGITGTAYSFTFAASGGTAPYTWTAATLPTGVTMSTAGVLSGTPTKAGTFATVVTVKEAGGGTVSKTFSIVITAPLAISTKSLTAGRLARAYTATLAATGGTAPYTWSATGLPAGLTLSTAGVLSGTVNVAGTYSITFTATDALGATVSTVLSLSVK